MNLVACGPCLSITQQTTLKMPKLYNGVYWYFTPNYSFGFSDTSTINQNVADSYNASNNLRLSWHMDQTCGGYRLGKIVNLNYNTTYYKYVFLSNIPSFDQSNFFFYYNESLVLDLSRLPFLSYFY